MRRLLTIAALVVLAAAPRLAAAEAIPFHDLGSVGGMVLCDGRGNAITGGGVNDQPFLWKAVSSVKAPAPYDGPGHSAALYAYQPRQDAYPDQWNGDSMTAASEYPTGKRPATAGTQLDPPLSTFLTAYPATWDHLVQLRMFWGARSQGFDGRHYVTAVIKVEGDRWRLVSAPVSGCQSSSALSTEVTVAHLNTTPTPGPGGSARPTPGIGRPAAVGSAGAGTVNSAGSSAGTASEAASRQHSASWGSVLTWAAVVVGGLSVPVYLLRRRRAR